MIGNTLDATVFGQVIIQHESAITRNDPYRILEEKPWKSDAGLCHIELFGEMNGVSGHN